MFNQFTFSLIFSDYFQNFIFLSSNKYSTRKKPIQIYKNLKSGKFEVMKVSRILKQCRIKTGPEQEIFSETDSIFSIEYCYRKITIDMELRKKCFQFYKTHLFLFNIYLPTLYISSKRLQDEKIKLIFK